MLNRKKTTGAGQGQRSGTDCCWGLVLLEKDNQIEVTAAEVSAYARITGRIVPALRDVLQRKVTAQAAGKAGITVSTAELQKAADYFRLAHGFNKARDTEDWLKSKAISIEALEEHLETNLLISKFKNYLVEEASPGKCSELPVGDESAKDKIYRDWVEARFK